MNRSLFAASALSTAIGLAMAMQAQPTAAQGMQNPPQIVKDNMARMQQQHLEKCYGINAAAKNDCAEGAHSCAGQATQARDKQILRAAPGRRLHQDPGRQSESDVTAMRTLLR